MFGQDVSWGTSHNQDALNWRDSCKDPLHSVKLAKKQNKKVSKTLKEMYMKMKNNMHRLSWKQNNCK